MHFLISEARIQDDIRELARTPRNSWQNPELHAGATSWVASNFENIGLVVSRQSFDIPGQSRPRRGENIIGILNSQNTDQPLLVVGAHYDTVPDSPGADDNASGVAAMLECARVLIESDSKRRIAFVAFDAEELQPPVDGLHGSTAYVAGLSPADKPSAAIIFESIGFSSPTLKQRLPGSFRILFRRAYTALKRQNFAANSLLILSKGRGRAIARALEQSAAKPDVELPILPLDVPWWMPLVRNLRRSDHAPFWRAGIPAVMISDTANFRNPHYHRPTDAPDTIDVNLVARATRMVVDAIGQDSV